MKLYLGLLCFVIIAAIVSSKIESHREKEHLQGLSEVDQKSLIDNTKKIKQLEIGDIVISNGEVYVVTDGGGFSSLYLEGPGPLSNPNKKEIPVIKNMGFIKGLGIDAIYQRGENEHYVQSVWYKKN